MSAASETAVVDVSWMARFTDRNRGGVCTQPWTIEYKGAPWAIATNSHVIVMTPGSHGFQPNSMAPFAPVLNAPPTSAPQSLPLAEFRAVAGPYVEPAAKPECATCASKGRVDCEECGGAGDVDCECDSCGNDHSNECDACRGRGTIPCDCEWAIDASEAKTEYTRVGTGRLNLDYLRRALQRIPDAPATWQQDEPDKVAVLKCGVWTLWLMPIRSDHSHQDVVQFRLGAAA